MSIFTELKRRNVFKVAASYAIVAWIVLQVADTTFPALNIPAWVLSLLTVLFLLGFPIALFLAWAYEMTPEGIKPTAEVPVDASIRTQTGRKMNALIVGGLGLLLVVVALDAFVLDDASQAGTETAAAQAPVAVEPETTVVPFNSIAVLPFVNLSSDAEQEYFSDGLSEEILNQLAQIRELRVTARTSSFAFKGKTEDMRLIGQQLGVRHILEGSVRKAGDELRITAQLIDAADGTHIWSRTYDRTLNDVFAIQEEIAMEVSGTLSVALDVGAMSRARGGTNNIEAYDNYLRARELDLRRGGRDDLVQAAEYYRKAVELDPLFVRAWSDLHLELQSWLIYVPDRVAQARAEMEAIYARMTELAPDSVYTKTIRASTLVDQHRWAEAEAAIADVVAAGGNFRQDVTSIDTIFLLDVGRISQAIPNVRRRVQGDPLSLNASYGWQIMMHLADRYDEAQAEYERSKTLAGDHTLVDQFALFRMQKRRDLSAEVLRAQMESYLQNDSSDWAAFERGMVDKWDNRDAMLVALHAAFDDPASQTATSMLRLAGMADAFDDADLALAALRRSYIDYHGSNTGMLWQPFRNDLRNTAAFKRILEDLGLVAYFRQSGNWGEYCRPLGDDFECE